MKPDFKNRWLTKNALWHVVFILVILYNVSSINVLILVVGMLPILQGASLNTTVLTYFAEISFGICAFLCVFHLSTMFRRKKRSPDKLEELEAISFGETWERSRFLSKLLFVLIIFYILVSVYFLLWALGIADKVPVVEDDMMWIASSIVSFALATVLAGFHLATLIFRRKRVTDHLSGVGKL